MSVQHFDVWMDLACPWSRMTLTEMATREDFDVTLHAFRIDPDAPADYGHTTIEHLSLALDIDETEANRMLDVVRNKGAEVGMSFNFDIARGGSLMDAHRLIQCAHETNHQLALALEFFTAHFESGLLLNDHDVLFDIAQRVGMLESRIREVLGSNEFKAAVLADEEIAQQNNYPRPHIIPAMEV